MVRWPRVGLTLAATAFTFTLVLSVTNVPADTRTVEECTSWVTSSSGDRWCGEWTSTQARHGGGEEVAVGGAIGVAVGMIVWATTRE